MDLKALICNKELINHFDLLTLPEQETLFHEVEQIYNSFGQILVQNYLKSEEYVAQNWQMADGLNPLVETAILKDPFRIWIYVNQIPEHIRAFRRSRFAKNGDFSSEHQRWILIMNTAFRELKKQGLRPFKDKKIIAVYKFNFSRIADSDNYTMRYINNSFRDVGLIKDDNIQYLATYCDGVINPDKPGIEITLVSETDFSCFYQNFIL